MEINVSIPAEELTFVARLDFLAEIAEMMSKEAQQGPDDAILALLAAAALVAQQNSAQTTIERRQTLMPLLLNAIESVRIAFPGGHATEHECGQDCQGHEPLLKT